MLDENFVSWFLLFVACVELGGSPPEFGLEALPDVAQDTVKRRGGECRAHTEWLFMASLPAVLAAEVASGPKKIF